MILCSMIQMFRIRAGMPRDTDSHVGPFLTHGTPQKLWNEEKMVIMYPNQVTWLKN